MRLEIIHSYSTARTNLLINVWVYIYRETYVHICMYGILSIPMYVAKYVCSHVCVYVYMYVYAGTNLFIYIEYNLR